MVNNPGGGRLEPGVRLFGLLVNVGDMWRSFIEWRGSRCELWTTLGVRAFRFVAGWVAVKILWAGECVTWGSYARAGLLVL